jgi:superfamily II DNA/RNA helicase
MQKSRKMMGTTMNVSQLVSKVNDETGLKTVEQPVINRFEDFQVDPRIKANIRAKGYTVPTPIQDKAIPVGLQGRDVIGIANTGTGKTAAFLIPLINKMLTNRVERAIILAPTRELAMQTHEELFDFAKGFSLNSVLCIGGSNIQQQIRMLKRPYNFIIGTPGRILDLIKRRLLVLDRFSNVVLDEADRMVDMGFINDIKLILGKLAPVRQSFFFTATLDPKVEELIRQFLKNPEKISVKMRATAANVDQDIIKVPNDSRAKLMILIEMLRKKEFEKVLVFGRTKHGVEKVAKGLHAAGIRADSIHGNKTQNYRMKALSRFKKSEIKVLVATDVAARGLDISAVSHVINFDIPANYDDYVHRIGRTGRAEMKGIALTFVTGQ